MLSSHPSEHAGEVEFAPFVHFGSEPTQRPRPGLADSTIVVGHHVHARLLQVRRKRAIKWTRHARGRVDDDQRVTRRLRLVQGGGKLVTVERWNAKASGPGAHEVP